MRAVVSNGLAMSVCVLVDGTLTSAKAAICSETSYGNHMVDACPFKNKKFQKKKKKFK